MMHAENSDLGRAGERRQPAGGRSVRGVILGIAILACWGWVGRAGAMCGDYVVYGPPSRTQSGESKESGAGMWTLNVHANAWPAARHPAPPCDGPECGSVPENQGVPEAVMSGAGPTVRAVLSSQGPQIASSERDGWRIGWTAASGRFAVVPAPDRPPGA
jgi:hypothetical protein